MIRITGGEFRGRSIRTPRIPEHGSGGTRPTQAKLRQALFNSLQMHIPGARVLDLFAGPGTLGFEALSRGADRVVFVESARPVSKLILENADELGLKEKIRVFSEPLDRAVSHLEGEAPFDIVLADPPYAGGFEIPLLTTVPWGKLLQPEGFLCLEWGLVKSVVTELPEAVPVLGTGGHSLLRIREKKYGDSVLTTYRLQTAPA